MRPPSAEEFEVSISEGEGLVQGELGQDLDETLSTVRHDITAVETDWEESKAQITRGTDQAVTAGNGREDFTSEDLAAAPERLHATQTSFTDGFNEDSVARSDWESNVAGTDARLKSDIRQKL